MLIKIGKQRNVSVVDKDCGERECFNLGFDKGTFAQGVGYTSYHRDGKGKLVERPVCATRHYHGCPTNSVCPLCRTASVLAPGEPCPRRVGGQSHYTRVVCSGLLETPASEGAQQ